MKLMKWLKAHPATLKDVATSTCLLGASAGIVFGVSAGMFKVQYMPLDSAEARLEAATTAGNNYYLEDINSEWNMKDQKDSDGNVIIPEPDGGQATTPIWNDGEGLEWWRKLHPKADPNKAPWLKAKNADPGAEEGKDILPEAIKARHDLVAMVIDGATHSTMDRSFNQSLYEGLVDYVKNKKVDHYDPENLQDPVNNNTVYSFKPSQDTTTEIVNIYISTIHNKTIIGVAGFNHATPINTLMTHKNNSALIEGPDSATTKELDESCFVLVDSVIPNNQDVASVQFRADQPGFLAAIATCQYFYNNLDMYHDKHQDLEVAAFGGVQIPTVIDYIGGFQRGIELFNYSVLRNILNKGSEYYFNEGTEEKWKFLEERFENLVNHSKYKADIEELSSSQEFKDEYLQKLYDEYSVKMIKLGEIGTHFSGTFAAGDAIGITKQYLNRGASAIIAVAGPQSLDAAQEIRNQNSKCIVIGVDTAMENSDYQRFHEGCSEKNKEKPNTNDKYMDQTVDAQGNHSSEANGIIKFSAIKDIKEVTNRITRLYLNGRGWDVSRTPNNDTGLQPDPIYAVCGPGYKTCGNIKNGLISISWDGFLPLMQALQCIEFVDNTKDHTLFSFDDVWQVAIESYKNVLKNKGEEWEAIDQKYKEGIKNIENIKTFDKKSTWYKNYHHTIGILAEMFAIPLKDNITYQIPFDRTMTLRQEGENWRVLDEGEINYMSINEWLTQNMYMIS